MQNLKISSTSTPYWCVVVPVDSCEFFVNKVGCIRYTHNKGRESSCIEPMQLGWYATEENTAILGCITSSGMDEGVREIDTMLAEHWAGICSHWKVNIMKLLTHNQITLTDSTKAVVLKQKA